jgi:hypothetical protein
MLDRGSSWVESSYVRIVKVERRERPKLIVEDIGKQGPRKRQLPERWALI